MNQHLHDQIILLAEESYKKGDTKLAVIMATVHGCYVHDSLPELFEAITLHLGRGAATELLRLVAEGLEAKKGNMPSI